jgi:hypothetical protein
LPKNKNSPKRVKEKKKLTKQIDKTQPEVKNIPLNGHSD